MRLIDADALKYEVQLEGHGNGMYQEVYYITADDVDAQPTVDAVPVIRCRECRHYAPMDSSRPYDCAVGMADTMPEDYCSRAERREDDRNNDI